MKLKWEYKWLTEYVTKVTWGGSSKQGCRSITFGIAHSPFQDGFQKPNILLGDAVALYDDEDNLIFFGNITTRERKSEIGELQYTAKDRMQYLLRSSGTYKFEGKSPEQITKNVCEDLRVPVGKIVSTKMKIDKIFFMERPFYEIIMAAYTKAYRKTKKPYIAVMEGKKLTVKEKGKMIPDFLMKQGERITESTYTETTDNMVNRVAIYDSDNKKIGTVENNDWISTFGPFQNALSVESGNGKEEAQAQLQGVEKTATLTALGDIRCVAGAGIKIEDKYSRLTGKYWIESDTHTWENGVHMMSLEIAFKNEMDVQEEDEEPVKDTVGYSVSTNGVGGQLNGQRVRAKFTAYYPANNAMEGGFLDALGNRLNPDKNTMAAPPSVKFHTQVQILNTGTSRDGGVYEVLDRGGAIQIEAGGVYHFDILMHSAAECNNWGVKMGYAIIGDGTGYSQVPATGTGGSNKDKILNEARKWIGTRESGVNNVIFNTHYYGGVVSGSAYPWCCAFVWDVFRMAGLSHLFMGGGKTAYCFTVSNWYKARGKTVSTPAPGDLVVYGGSGHIGIVETVHSGGFVAIEGNYSNMVTRVTRGYSNIVAFCRPDY